MALTISEASAVNVLLSRLLAGIDGPPADETEEAMILLADHAYKPLGAGWDGARVRAAVKERDLR